MNCLWWLDELQLGPEKLLAVLLGLALQLCSLFEAEILIGLGAAVVPGAHHHRHRQGVAEDQRLLAKVATEILGRPVSFRASTTKAGPVSPSLRENPEVAEYLRLFPGRVIEE